MCGLVGSVGMPPTGIDLSAAMGALRHRGPDHGDLWASEDGLVQLGHRRLSILDLSHAGDQPMRTPDGSLTIVFNGEIYNFPALRQELETRGHTFRTTSDTEAILYAYREWGTDCVDRLEGMFAFALWDDSRQRLFLARDRMGMKPLFLVRQGSAVAFASEATALRHLLRPSLDLRVSPRALGHVLTLGYVPAPDAIWQGMEKLPMGHCMTWSPAGDTRTWCYWEPPRHLHDGPPEDRSDEAFRHIFEDVVKEHLIADVPLTLFLSGGLDSAATAAAVAASGAHLPSAITVGFPGSSRDETDLAAATAAHLGLDHRVEPQEGGDVARLLDRVAADYDEPIGYSAALSMHQLCAKAASFAKVAVAGDGGDEVFGGYSWHRSPTTGRGPTHLWLRRRLALAGGDGPLAKAARRAATRLFAQGSTHHAHTMGIYPRFLPEEVEALLAPTGLHFDDDTMLRAIRAADVPDLPPRRRMQRIDLMTFCADHCCVKVDRSAMAHGLEVRTPFLDRRIVEFGLTMPEEPEEATHGKLPVRRYLRDRLPESLQRRPKAGFSTPLTEMDIWDDIHQRIDESPLVQNGLLVPNWSRVLGTRGTSAKGRLWTLAAVATWLSATGADGG